jgi:hypothetical protein
MTDIDRLKILLDEWEVPYIEENCVVTLQVGDTNDKLTGYLGFVTCITFDEDGKFKHIGIWE